MDVSYSVISGSFTGAGGIQGLLAITDTIIGKTYLPLYDGHGNVTYLLDGETGEEVAQYEYDPFGILLRSTGEAACPFRFSTKYTDQETGLVYYGYRYYSAETGRWLNQDPIEEEGGLNLYGFVGNDPVNRWDLLGHDFLDCMADCIKDNDPVDNFIPKLIIAIGNTPVHKAWVLKLYELLKMDREAKLLRNQLANPRMSKFGAIPNSLRTILSNKLNISRLGLGGRLVAGLGSIFQVFTAATGTLYLGIEVHCAGACCGSNNYDPAISNKWDELDEFYRPYIEKAINIVTEKE